MGRASVEASAVKHLANGDPRGGEQALEAARRYSPKATWTRLPTSSCRWSRRASPGTMRSGSSWTSRRAWEEDVAGRR